MASYAHFGAPAAAQRRSLRIALSGDEQLARLVTEGSDHAFAVLHDRYAQMLYRYCSSIVRDEADAQDALQSALLAALTALRRGQRGAPLRPWLFRIAHNEAVSILRRRRPADELSEAHAPAVAAADDRADERDRLASLVSDLSRLPERQRGALVMRELSGLSHEEIAAALETSVGAAKQAIFEARRTLFEFAEGRAMACEEVRRLVSDGDGRALRGRRVRAHLRDCAGCSAFADAIPSRRADLRALAPLLPALAAGGLLANVAHLARGHGATATGVGKSAAATLGVKSAVGVAVVAIAAAGATMTVKSTETHGGSRSVTTQRLRSAPATARSGSAAARARSGVATALGAAAQGLGGPAAGVAATSGEHKTTTSGGAADAARGALTNVGHTTNGRHAAARPTHRPAQNRNHSHRVSHHKRVTKIAPPRHTPPNSPQNGAPAASDTTGTGTAGSQPSPTQRPASSVPGASAPGPRGLDITTPRIK